MAKQTTKVCSVVVNKYENNNLTKHKHTERKSKEKKQKTNNKSSPIQIDTSLPKDKKRSSKMKKKKKLKSPIPKRSIPRLSVTQKSSNISVKRSSKMRRASQLHKKHTKKNEKEDKNDEIKEEEEGNGGLYDYDFLDCLDKLSVFDGAKPIIPQIVLVGARGCGKTSLLERITGIELQKGRHYSTHCPLEFNIIRDIKLENDQINGEVLICYRFDDDANKWMNEQKVEEFAKIVCFEDMMKLSHYLRSAQQMIRSNNEYLDISPNSIVVNIYGAEVEDVRIVDLPGWIDKSVDLKRNKFYDRILSVYINENNDNVLAFMFNALSDDMNQSDLFCSDLIDAYLDNQHNAIGIVTNLRNIRSLDKDCKWLQSVLKDGYKSIKRFVAIICFNDYDIDNAVTADELKQIETDLITSQEPWTYLFDIRSSLGMDNLLNAMGEAVMISIQSELKKAKNKIDDGLKNLMTEYKKIPPLISSKDAIAACSQILTNFCFEIEQHLQPNHATLKHVNSHFMTLRKEINLTRPRLVTKGGKSDILNGIFTMNDLMKLTQINSSKNHRSYDDIMHGVRHFLVESVISSKWSLPSSNCLSSVHSIIGTLLDYVSQKHVHQFASFKNSIRQRMAEVASKLLGSAKKEIETMLFREKNCGIVDQNALRQKVNYYKSALKSKVFANGNKVFNENIKGILCQTWAYFDIASNRYCDNVIMIIESILINSLHNELSQCFSSTYLTQKAVDLVKFFVPKSSQKKHKSELMKQYKAFIANRQHLNVIIYRNESLLQLTSKSPSNRHLSLPSLTENGLQQIQPLDLPQSPKYDEEIEQNEGKGTNENNNLMAMQTAINTDNGESLYGEQKDHVQIDDDDKEKMDALVHKLAQINAQLKAQQRKLENEQIELQKEREELYEKQAIQSEKFDEIESEYEELNELRDEFEQEKEDFEQQKNKVLAHIHNARSRLESAAHRMIEEREKFEREKQEYKATNVSGTNVSNSMSEQQQMMLEQMENQRILMKQMRDAMMEQKQQMQAVNYLDAEKENVKMTLEDIEEMMNEIGKAEKENIGKAEHLEKVRLAINEKEKSLNEREIKLKQREIFVHEESVKYEATTKENVQKNELNNAKYENKIKQLEIRNQMLVDKLKQIKHAKSDSTNNDDFDVLDDDFSDYSDDSYDIDSFLHNDDDESKEVSKLNVPSNVSSQRRSTPTPIKNKKQILSTSSPTSLGISSSLSPIKSKQELSIDSVSDILESTTTSNSKQKEEKRELITDEMMNEFDDLISSQTQITNDIQTGLNSAFKLLGDDFQDYIRKNVELLSIYFLYIHSPKFLVFVRPLDFRHLFITIFNGHIRNLMHDNHNNIKIIVEIGKT